MIFLMFKPLDLIAFAALGLIASFIGPGLIRFVAFVFGLGRKSARLRPEAPDSEHSGNSFQDGARPRVGWRRPATILLVSTAGLLLLWGFALLQIWDCGAHCRSYRPYDP